MIKHFTKASHVGALVALVAVFVAALPGAPASPSETPLPFIPKSCRLSEIGSLEVSEAGGLGRIEFHDKVAAVLQRDEGTVALLDISDPKQPKRVGEYADGIADSFDGDLAFSDDGRWLLYARQTHQFSKDGIHVLDVSDPASPMLMNYQPTGGAYRIEYLKDKDGAEWVFLLDAVHGLVVYRFESTTGQLVPVAIDALPALKVGGPASAGFFIDKNKMYVTTGETGLQIYDIGDPTQPAILGEWSEVGLAEVEVKGNTAYAATEYWFDASLKPEVVALNVKKPSAIEERRRLYFGGTALGGERVQGMDLTPYGDLLLAHSGLGLISTGPGKGCDVRPKGKANPGSGVTGSPYSMDVEIGPGGNVYLTDAATGTLSVLRYRLQD